MSDFSHYSTSLAARDAIKRIASEVVDFERPTYKYAHVVAVDRPNFLASVIFNGETESCVVAFGNACKAFVVGDLVRVSGMAGDRYISDSFGQSTGLVYATATMDQQTYTGEFNPDLHPLDDVWGVFDSSVPDILNIPETGRYNLSAHIDMSVSGGGAGGYDQRRMELWYSSSSISAQRVARKEQIFDDNSFLPAYSEFQVDFNYTGRLVSGGILYFKAFYLVTTYTSRSVRGSSHETLVSDIVLQQIA